MTIMTKCVECGHNVPQDTVVMGECPSCATIGSYNETESTIEFVAKGGFAVNVGLNPDDLDAPVANDASLWLTENVRVDAPEDYDGQHRVDVRDGALNNWVTVVPLRSDNGTDKGKITGIAADLNSEGVVAAWLKAGAPAYWTGVVDEGE